MYKNHVWNKTVLKENRFIMFYGKIKFAKSF
jgi:hypothetical protein